MEIILISEMNVDGCGSSANFMATIDHKITHEEEIRLSRNLDEVVSEGHDCWGTDEFCEEALNRTFGTGNWKTPTYTSIEF